MWLPNIFLYMLTLFHFGNLNSINCFSRRFVQIHTLKIVSLLRFSAFLMKAQHQYQAPTLVGRRAWYSFLFNMFFLMQLMVFMLNYIDLCWFPQDFTNGNAPTEDGNKRSFLEERSVCLFGHLFLNNKKKGNKWY